MVYKSPQPLRTFQNPKRVDIYLSPTRFKNASTNLTSSTSTVKDSILNFNIRINELLIDALVNDTSYQRKYFSLDPFIYEYQYSNGKLSKSKLPLTKRLNPYIEMRYRPINNFLDLNGGLNFKTRKFNYKLGINLSYYPKISSKVYKDIELGITYNF